MTVKGLVTSKQRVLAAVDLAEADRVPMDFHANPCVLQRLHRDLGTSSHRELLVRLRSDIVDLRGVVDPAYRGPMLASSSANTAERHTRYANTCKQNAIYRETDAS